MDTEIFKLLKETQEKSLSQKRKVGCVIEWKGKTFTGYNQYAHDDMKIGQPPIIQEWHAETIKRAKLYNKQNFIHAETVACDSFYKKTSNDTFSKAKADHKGVTVYVTHQPCEICTKYLNKMFNEPIIKVVNLDNKKAFIKHDDGKTQYQHLNPSFIEAMAEITTQGAKKYGGGNYLKGDENALMRIYDALMRHLQAWRSGEQVDQESRKSHLGHVACNAMMIYNLEKKIGLTKNDK